MHPTQVFLANPTALRIEYRLDDARLLLWWSPLAGCSTDCVDRNYSSRDAHLCVFESIHLQGCGLESFLGCDYDPYHCALRFRDRVLHIATPVDTPAVLVWSDQPLVVDLKSHRFDERLAHSPSSLVLLHPEPRHRFLMALALGPGTGGLRHCHFHAPEQPLFTQARLSAGQVLAIGVGLETSQLPQRLATLCAQGPDDLHAATDRALAPHLASGRIESKRYPELARLRDGVIRGLHSMIDESGAFRASLKAIYYLIWVRDSGFAFAYQAAGGWPHKLSELCRFLLDNPNHVTDPGLPHRRMFGQLIHRKLGKLEEDGLYYVVWTLFTHWTQIGHLDFMTAEDWALIDEALSWVEEVTWDEQRGLFGEYTADESPAHGARDEGWDYAIGQPTGYGCIRYEGKAVLRNYDVYFNTCMHSVYVMLAAMRNDPRPLAKASRVWIELAKLLQERHQGIPTYGELLLEDGSRIHPRYWGPPVGASCCVWGLSMPNFLPLADWDAVRASVLAELQARPEMHFVNGICAAMNAADPWCYPETPLLQLHLRLAAETSRPGRFLPMGGAMPEKFGAPEGNLYHDIRPQGFAMGAWLAAWSGLGLRRLAYGLALRPTSAFERISNYPWRGNSLHVEFGVTGRGLGLEIDGLRVEGTLQVPESLLRNGSVVRLVSAPETTLWLRSSVRLESCEGSSADRCYRARAFGLSRITFSASIPRLSLRDEQGAEIPCQTISSDGLFHIDFTHFGALILNTCSS